MQNYVHERAGDAKTTVGVNHTQLPEITQQGTDMIRPPGTACPGRSSEVAMRAGEAYVGTATLTYSPGRARVVSRTGLSAEKTYG